eukprot:CCRYP_007829-RA/>CCRYP_007829-RA protein AED:0.46 eAED:0.46 QI:0/0/0/1/0/0/2/0/182
MAMKMICYGVSGNAFVDYFQMGETTTRRCVSFLSKEIVSCHSLANRYLRRPLKTDTRNIVSMHERVHKIPGMMGSLDVTKVRRRRFQLHGKDNFRTVNSLRALDWKRSLITIYGFGTMLLFDPHTKLAFSFAQDQESHRKDIERGFGVLRLKFLSLMHPINLHHKDDIYYLVLAAILMHNMM